MKSECFNGINVHKHTDFPGCFINTLKNLIFAFNSFVTLEPFRIFFFKNIVEFPLVRSLLCSSTEDHSFCWNILLRKFKKV